MSSKKINIALFSPSKNPYSETFIQAHKKYLKDNVFYYYGTGQNIRLEGYGNLLGSFSTILLSLQKRILGKPNHYLWSKPLLTSLKKQKIDSVLIEYGTHAYRLLPVLSKLELPIVVHFHGYDASMRDVIKNCNNYKEVFELTTNVIAVSLQMKEKLFKLGCSQKKIIYTPCAPNDKYFKVNPKYNKRQFVAIGRFVDKKAPYLTILAFKKIVKKHPDVILLMAGDGVLLDSCKNLVKQFHLEKNINFIGVINSDEVINIFSESIAFVQHSITADNGDMEGTPVSVLEASAAGLPVISTIHAGIPNVIIHNKTGFLCEEHDVDAMSNNMLKILENVELAKEMGAEGKKHIQQNFNMNRHINVIQAALES